MVLGLVCDGVWVEIVQRKIHLDDVSSSSSSFNSYNLCTLLDEAHTRAKQAAGTVAPQLSVIPPANTRKRNEHVDEMDLR